MRQGEIWYADLNPTQGSEQAGRRPVVIISGNLLNQYLPIVVVAPLTSKIKNYKGNPVIKPSASNGLKSESEMLVFHIRSVSKDRLKERLGTIDEHDLVLAIKTLNDILKY
ncbi:type II toxin-antitoxin system PemK/MazF family toxin [Chryseosolibacter indicus]|uniref:mRNA interferase n=1 Tax=Chryseosolibacter indicus TaxID=2782351 RepID=A0ABS5W0Q6_9BACT|nr:type II toxin-antitoxin system PemK/MazF family toxin [Chryseosolibacter indicus]MBT1706549.1 type II toxin-antitoxin system PemK/MazF family toxin [Chryseosolibacter indicus]